MEDFLGIIIAILIGVAAKWIEGRHKNDDESVSVPKPAPERNRMVARRSAPPVPAPMRKPAPAPAPAPVRHAPAPKPVAKPLPKAEPLFEEGQCAVRHEKVEESAFNPTEADNEALVAHYERWRRAIIDAQIITPKFND